MIFENNSSCLFTQILSKNLFYYREDRAIEGKYDSYKFSYTDNDKGHGPGLPPFDKTFKIPTSFDEFVEQVRFRSIHHSFNYFYLTQSQFENSSKISIIDGLHRCYALLQYIKMYDENWKRLLTCKRTVALKMFVIKERFRKDIPFSVIPHLLTLLKDYSFEIYNQRRATVGHTFFDAIKNTILREAKEVGNTPGQEEQYSFKYLNTGPPATESKQFFSRTGKDRKKHLKTYFLLRMQNIHKTMCKTDEYLNLLLDKNGQVVKDSMLHLEEFDRNKDNDKVSIKSVKNYMKFTHILTIFLITSDS